jgi:nitroimidazol reductase NimA-like FMN-containing flavoprotein (pyridoxamine 5'-phosphate oxidase superfamily)
VILNLEFFAAIPARRSDMKRTKALDAVRVLLASQRFGVLSTINEDVPHGTLVAIAVSEDLSNIYFCTPKATRKYRNLQSNSRVALTVDTRSNNSKDLSQAAAVTAVGAAETMDAGELEKAMQIYVTRHPQLKKFATAPSTQLMAVRVRRYLYVERFQNVTEIEID